MKADDVFQALGRQDGYTVPGRRARRDFCSNYLGAPVELRPGQGLRVAIRIELVVDERGRRPIRPLLGPLPHHRWEGSFGFRHRDTTPLNPSPDANNLGRLQCRRLTGASHLSDQKPKNVIQATNSSFAPTCTFDRTVGLLSVSEVDTWVAGRMMQARLYHPPIPLARFGRAERHHGNRRPNGLRGSSLLEAVTQVMRVASASTVRTCPAQVAGALARARCLDTGGTASNTLVVASNLSVAQGLPVTSAQRHRANGSRVASVSTAVGRVLRRSPEAPPGEVPRSAAAARQNFALDLADQLGYVVGEIEVMTGKDPRAELRCGALRPGHHLFVRGNFVVITQERGDGA